MTRQEAIQKIRAIPNLVQQLENKGLSVDDLAQKIERCTHQEMNDFVIQAWLIGKSLE